MVVPPSSPRVAFLATGWVVVVSMVSGCAPSSGTSQLEQRYLDELRVSDDWRDLSTKLGDLRSRKAIEFFLGEMARALPRRIGLPPRGEAEARALRKRDGDLFEGSVYSLLTMLDRMGETEFLRLLLEILADRKVPPEIRAMAAHQLEGCTLEQLLSLDPEFERHSRDPDPLVRKNVLATLARIQASHRERGGSGAR